MNVRTMPSWPVALARSLAGALLLLSLAVFATTVRADPPARVVALTYADGSVTFAPAGRGEWGRAVTNRPLIPGDALWVDDDSRAELRTGGAALRLAPLTNVTLLNADDRLVQIRLTQGTLTLSVMRMARGQVFEIATPNLALRVQRPGVYRVDAEPQGLWTEVAVRSGSGEAYGEARSFVLNAGRGVRFHGTDLADYEMHALGPADGFDRWCDARDRRWQRAVASRYVSPELVGYEALDDHGRWVQNSRYGTAWVPHAVPAGWSPYRDGHWAWIEPWGWTWIDEAPWGFAPSHYGRWARIDVGWAWVPGPVAVRPVYAPAVVQFVAASPRTNVTLTIGGINAVAWFPLAPREVYVPPYRSSPAYVRAINVTNTVVAPAQVVNVYSTQVTQVTNFYTHAHEGALVAMPAESFARAQPIARSVLRVPPQAVVRAPVVAAAPVAPTAASMLGATTPAARTPPAAVIERPVIAKAPPAQVRVPAALGGDPQAAARDTQQRDSQQRDMQQRDADRDVRAQRDERGPRGGRDERPEARGREVPSALSRPAAPAVRIVQAPTPAQPLPAPAARPQAEANPQAPAPRAEPSAAPRAAVPPGPGRRGDERADTQGRPALDGDRRQAEQQAREREQQQAREREQQAQAQARERSEQQARERQQAEQQAQQRQREEAEQQAQQRRRQQADQQAQQRGRDEAEQQARERQRQQAEQQARQQAEQQARQQAEQQARQQAEQRARQQQAEQQARQQAEQQARQQAEQQARQQAEQQARQREQQQAREREQQQAREREQQAAREREQQARAAQAQQRGERAAPPQAARREGRPAAQEPGASRFDPKRSRDERDQERKAADERRRGEQG